MDIDLYTSALSSMSCFWIIFKYFQQPKDNIGHLLIFVLAISDLLFAISILTLHFVEEETTIQDAIFFCSMQFSIMWAAAVSIVYKSLRDTTLNTMRLFKRILTLLLLLSSAITTLYFFSFYYSLILKGYTSIVQSNSLSLIFYH